MKSLTQQVAAHDRHLRALELRIAGASYRVIAKSLGYKSVSSVHTAIERALKQTVQEPADELRKLEMERLDAMGLKVWEQVRSGNLGAVDRMLRIMERRSKLLGLDAPVRHDVKTEHTWIVEIRDLLQQGKVTAEEIEAELGPDIAKELFESIGLPASTSRAADTEG